MVQGISDNNRDTIFALRDNSNVDIAYVFIGDSKFVNQVKIVGDDVLARQLEEGIAILPPLDVRARELTKRDVTVIKNDDADCATLFRALIITSQKMKAHFDPIKSSEIPLTVLGDLEQKDPPKKSTAKLPPDTRLGA